LWASQPTTNRVVRIDPTTERVVAPIAVGNGASGIAFGDGAAWVANSLTDRHQDRSADESSGRGDDCDRRRIDRRCRRRARRLGQQPVRRHAGAHPRTNLPARRQRRQSASRSGDHGRQWSWPSASRAPSSRRHADVRINRDSIHRHCRRLTQSLADPAHDERRPRRVRDERVGNPARRTSRSRFRPRPTAAGPTRFGCGPTSAIRTANLSCVRLPLDAQRAFKSISCPSSTTTASSARPAA
jgi:hypothetical protein